MAQPNQRIEVVLDDDQRKELEGLVRPGTSSTRLPYEAASDSTISKIIGDCLIYGAYASVRIRYEGTLEQLAGDLASALNLKSFAVEPSEYPPHEKVGMAEAFGWEAWLQADTGNSPHNFRLRIETENSITEAIEGRMHDLSQWFARLLRTLSDIEASPDMSTAQE